MFGFVRVNAADLTDAEKARYRAHYCGLCRTLGKRHGQRGRMTLTYDMTFLAILLASLYEPEEEQGVLRCVPHPAKPHAFVSSEITDYAADMTIALTYHKCLDDWADDHKQTSRACAALLRRSYRAVTERWPRQTEAIERELQALSLIEKRSDANPDAAANCFGRLMAELFVLREDYWQGALRSLGMSLGRYIYLADAACDYDDDKKSGGYNPLILMELEPEAMRPYLTQALGTASSVFESLPLVQDETILRNILYSGLWQTYNETMEKRNRRKDEDKHGR